MNVVIRVDASRLIGTGHVMRCLVLADSLSKRGHQVIFICRDLPLNLSDYIQRKYSSFLLPFSSEGKYTYEKFNFTDNYSIWLGVSQEQDAEETLKIIKNNKIDLLIVDHYGLDILWENQVRPYVNKIMVIDDLGNRLHNCDFLLDQNLHKKMNTRYKNLVPQNCKLMLGPSYALLRPEFAEKRKHVKPRSGKINEIIVFMGGHDLSNQTCRILEIINEIEFNGIVNVIMGTLSPHIETVKKLCKKNNQFKLHVQIQNMEELMAKADMAIGAGGATVWERCCLGLPSIVIGVAKNQDELCHFMNQMGFLKYLGLIPLKRDFLKREIKKLLLNPFELKSLSKKSMTLVDGFGSIRVLDEGILID